MYHKVKMARTINNPPRVQLFKMIQQGDPSLVQINLYFPELKRFNQTKTQNSKQRKNKKLEKVKFLNKM